MKKVPLILAILIAAFCFGWKAEAATLFSENFDSCSTGNAETCNEWFKYGINETPLISTIQKYSSPNSLFFDNSAGSRIILNDIEDINSGRLNISFQYYQEEATGSQILFYLLNSPSTSSLTSGATFKRQLGYTDLWVQLGTGGSYVSLGNPLTDSWNKVEIIVDYNDSEITGILNDVSATSSLSFSDTIYMIGIEKTSTDFHFYFDDILISNECSGWTDWANCVTSGDPVYPIVPDGNCLWNEEGGNCYSPGTTEAADWNWSSTYPVECYYNQESWAFATTAAGHFTVPTNPDTEGVVFDLLYFTGRSVDTGEYYYASTSFYKTQGQTLNFQIPYNFATSIFGTQFNYTIFGHEIADPNHLYHQAFTCDESYLGIPASSTLDLLKCDLELLGEPCTTTFWESLTFQGAMQKVSCEIQETMIGTFIPSCSKRAELDKWLALLKTRAPYSYVTKLTTFLSGFVFTTTTDTTTITNIADQFSQLNFFVYVRHFFKILLYLAFGFVLYKLLKHMFK